MSPSHAVTSGTSVISNQKLILVSLVCHPKCRVLSVSDVPFKVFQVNSQYDVIRVCQTVCIVVSKPELTTQISKAVSVGFPSTIEVNRAVLTSLKNGPTSTFRCHVTQHLDWIATIWIDGIYATGVPTVSKQFGADFSFYRSRIVAKKEQTKKKKQQQLNKPPHFIHQFAKLNL